MSTKAPIKRSESAKAATRSHYQQRGDIKEKDCDSLLLMNPNASEDEQLSPASPDLHLAHSDSKERLGKAGKSRGSSQSFLKLLVGSLRGGKQGSAQLDLDGGGYGSEPVPQSEHQHGSLSDTEEIVRT